jgi:hypothetical protein
MSRARVDDEGRQVKVTDPVCGMQVDPSAAAARVTHEGRRFGNALRLPKVAL